MAQLPKWIRDRSIHSLFKPKYDSWLFVNFCVFTPSYLFLPGVNLKLFWKSKQVRMGKAQKSTNSQASSFGLIEENMELCRIH